MAIHNVGAGEISTHDHTLAAGVVDSVNFATDPNVIEVLSNGAASIYVTIDGSTPTVGGAHTYELPAARCARKIRHLGNQAVRLISAGTPTYSVSVTSGEPGLSLIPTEGSGLPSGGDVGDVVTNTAPGEGEWSPPVESSRLDLVPAPEADVSLNSHKIINLLDPTSAQDAATRAYVLAVRDALINGAPGTLDTLNEIAAQLATDESAAAALVTTVAGKIPLTYLDTDGTLAANSDAKIASQKAVRTYVAANGGGSVATVSAEGTVKLASAPADALHPIVVGDNDNRLSAPPRIVTMPQPGRTLYLDPTLPAGVESQFDIGPVSVQTLTMTGTPAGGSTAMTAAGIGGPVALTVLYNSTAAQLQTLLDTVYGRNEAVVTGGPWPGTALVVTWQGPTYLSKRVAPLTFDNTLLTGGTSPSAAAAQTQTSSPWSYTTDAAESSRAVLTIATSREGIILAKPQYTFRDSEIMVRFRASASMHSSSVIKAFARWLGVTNHTYAFKSFGASLTSEAGLANGGAAAAYRTTPLIDLGAGVWRMKLRRVDRYLFAKFWREAVQTAVQTVTIGGGASGGTFTLTYGGQTTSALPFGESAANVQTALRALTSIGASNVTVTGTGPYVITFAGTLASVAVTVITGSAAGLTGGTPTLTVAWTTYGSDGKEPDWQISGEIPLAAGNANVDQEIGVNGVSFTVYTAGVYVSEVYITELLPPTDSIAINGDFTKLDNVASTPLGWAGLGTVGTAVSEIVNVAGPDGATRRFVHLFKDTDNVNPAHVEQSLYLRPRTGRGHLPSNSQEFPGALEIGVTSKATNVRHLTAGSDFLGAGIVIYYNDEKDTGLNLGRPDYYAGFGPLGIVGGSDATLSGSGGGAAFGQTGLTWGWRRDVLRIPLPFPGRVYYIRLSIGMHDSDAAGDLWIGDVTIRPVA